MDAIRLYSAQVPDKVKKVVRILVKGSEEDVEDLLPIELGKIDRNATECLRLAQAVEAKFEHVMDLTGELLEVSSEAKEHYKKSQKEFEIKRNIALAKEETARKKLALAKEQKEKLEKQVKEAKAGWEEAMDSMPSGWGLVGMQCAETLTRTVCDVASVCLPLKAMTGLSPWVYISTLAAQKLLAKDPSTQETPTVVQDVPSSVPPSVPSSFHTETLMPLITKLVDDVFSIFEKGSKETKDERSNGISEVKFRMEGLEKEWSSKEDSPDKEQALQLLTRGLKICTKALSSIEQLNLSPEEMEEIKNQASKLQRDICAFYTKARAKAGQNPLYTMPPIQAKKMASSANSFSSSAVKSAAASAQYKVAEARGLLERQEDRYDHTCKELKERNEELSKALQSLAEFRPEEIADFDKIRDTLREGILALSLVREQWQKLVAFFQYITNIIKVCQKESLSSFVEYAKVGQKRVLANGYASTDFMRDLIYEQVSQASTTSYVVWSISNTYVEISSKHLMSNIASLGHLIALDPEKERGSIQAKRNELMEASQEAQEAIRKHVSEAKDHFHEKVAKRIKKIETELLKALPSEDPAKINEINDSVKNAIKEADEELDADKFWGNLITKE